MIKSITLDTLKESVARLSVLSGSERLAVALRNLELSVARLERTNALSEMTERSNPYFPLVRVMCRLELIKDWSV